MTPAPPHSTQWPPSLTLGCSYLSSFLSSSGFPSLCAASRHSKKRRAAFGELPPGTPEANTFVITPWFVQGEPNRGSWDNLYPPTTSPPVPRPAIGRGEHSTSLAAARAFPRGTAGAHGSRASRMAVVTGKGGHRRRCRCLHSPALGLHDPPYTVPAPPAAAAAAARRGAKKSSLRGAQQRQPSNTTRNPCPSFSSDGRYHRRRVFLSFHVGRRQRL